MKAYKIIGVLVVALVLAVGGLFLVLGPVTTTGAQVPDSAPTPTPPDTSQAVAPVQPGDIAHPDALTDVGIGLESLAQIVGPPLIPPPDVPGYYAPLPAGVTQVTAAGPVAYLADPPAEVAESIAVHTSPHKSGINMDIIAFAVRSSVRYSDGEHTVLVTTAQFSPAAQEAYAQGRIQLGTEAIHLTDGTSAWFVEQKGLLTPNWVVFQRDDYFITIASDLPAAEVKALASRIVFNAGDPDSPDAGP